MSLPTITRSNFDEHIPLSENLHIVAAIADDDTTGEPWKEHDGHGPITDWVTRAKRSGERILTQDGNSYRYYDVAEATRIAKRDGWGPMLDGMTRDQSIELAVDADFNHLQRWCNDQWRWVGVVVAIYAGETRLAIDSLWGIECDESDSENTYLVEVANELLTQELVDQAYIQLGKIALRPQLAGVN
jgi:hypothetical protein